MVYEGERRYDLVVRMADMRDADADKVKNILVPLPNGAQMPLGQLAEVGFRSAPAQVSREGGARRIVVETNMRGRDIQSTALDIKSAIDGKLKLPTGYHVEYGGTFKNLQEASARLMLTVPLAMALIFILLFFAFQSFKEALIIFSAVPLAAIGGVFALWARGLDFSISAGVGFIALFGVAVLNGIVLISYFNQLEKEGVLEVTERVVRGTLARLRPVLATAAVASLGFLPMALSTSPGSEVQRPLATVVIGGLITSTLLTLAVVPVLYHLVFSRRRKRSEEVRMRGGDGGPSAPLRGGGIVTASVVALLFCGTSLHAQAPVLTLDSAVARALRTYPAITAAELEVQQQEALRKTAFQLEPLNAQLQSGQINSAAHDINLQATTGIPFPTAIAQRSRYLKESVRLAESDRARIQTAVRESATSAYLQWAMGTERAQLLHRNDSAMQTLAVFAAKKFDAGATGRLEKVSAQSAADQARLAWNKSRSDIAVYAAELEQWTGPLNGALPDTVLLRALAMQPDPSTGAANNDPLLATAAQQAELAKAEWRMERSQWAPTLQGGGFYQTIDGVSPFSGFIIGTSIPLPGGGQGARTKAARLRSEIAAQQVQELQRSRAAELARTRAQWQQLQESLAYYEGSGAALAVALRHDAERAYLNGEAGYVEFLQGMEQARTIEEERLGVRYRIALTVIHLNALMGL